jgi:hypothetical protein
MAACAGPTLPGCAQGSREEGERWASGKGFPPPVASLGQYDELSSHLRFFKRRLPIYYSNLKYKSTLNFDGRHQCPFSH